MMSVKINYMTKGFVKYEHFKEMYVDLLNWRRENSFDAKDVKKTTRKISREVDQLFVSIYYNI